MENEERIEVILAELRACREIAMDQTVRARVPECGEFGLIAQGLDAALNELEQWVDAAREDERHQGEGLTAAYMMGARDAKRAHRHTGE